MNIREPKSNRSRPVSNVRMKSHSQEDYKVNYLELTKFIDFFFNTEIK